MPKEILDEAVNCLVTACGSPLLSNDDVIIARLLEFGYEKRMRIIMLLLRVGSH